MATVQVRDIPDDSYAVLVSRAKANHQSLQAYMREEIIALASRPTKAEALARIEAIAEKLPVTGLSAQSIVRDIHADRR
jgi:antitoxin FitA